MEIVWEKSVDSITEGRGFYNRLARFVEVHYLCVGSAVCVLQNMGEAWLGRYFGCQTWRAFKCPRLHTVAAEERGKNWVQSFRLYLHSVRKTAR